MKMALNEYVLPSNIYPERRSHQRQQGMSLTLKSCKRV